MKRTWLWTLGALIGLAVLSFALYLRLAPPTLAEGFVYGNGQIEATEVTVSAEVAAKVLDSKLVEGRAVNAGDVLVVLDEADVRRQLAQAQAQRLAAEKQRGQIAPQVALWKHHLSSAEADLQRYEKLRIQGNVSQQMLDRAHDQYEEARGRLASFEAQRQQADAALEAARQAEQLLAQQIAKTVIHAPIAGTLLSKGIEPGELAVPGRTIGVLADIAHLELKVYIPESQIGQIKLADPARVRVDAFPDRYFDATVARVDTRAQFTPKDVHMPDERARLVFGVTLAVNNPEGFLKPGMPSDAWIRWQPEAIWPASLPIPR